VVDDDQDGNPGRDNRQLGQAFPEAATLLPPGLVCLCAHFQAGAALLASCSPLLILPLLDFSLLTPFRLGEGLIGLHFCLAGCLRLFPGRIFQLALFPNAAALIP
jgi:hypothetical protein